MEKYLKIQGSIRLTIRLMLSIFVMLIASSTYLLIYYTEIKKTLNILQYDIINSISTPILAGVIMVSLVFIILMYYVFRYRRWAIMLILIFISIPLALASIGGLGYMIWKLDQFGFENINDTNRITILISFVAVLIFVWITTRACSDLFRLFKNIKNPIKLSRDLITEIRPQFMGLFMITILPFIILGGILVLLYNPVIPIEYDKSYLNMEGFDLNNPNYSDAQVCIQFESDLRDLQDISISNRFYGESTNTGIILAKNALLAETNKGIIFGGNLESSDEASNNNEMESAQTQLENYIKGYPTKWRDDLKILRKNLPQESVTKILNTIRSLPDNIRCNIRDDNNIVTELSPSLITFSKVSRLLNFAIELSLLEGNTDEAINILQSFHEYNTKFYNSNNLSFVGGMIGTAMIRKEFKNIESIVSYSNASQLKSLRDIYSVPYDINKNETNAWKGEYYRVNHLLTNRKGTMNELSIPYLLNGSDMIERMITLVYLPSIANINKDTVMQEKIEKSLIQNKRNITSPAEGIITGNKNQGWRNKFPFYMAYNPIGKNLIYPLLNIASSDFQKYHEKYRGSALYQNYIRYNLLGIEKK